MITKRMCYTVKRAVAAVLAAGMAFTMTGCGKSDKQESQTDSLAKEFVYVPEYISLGHEGEVNFYNMYASNDKLYYFGTTYDEAAMSSETTLYSYSLQNREENVIPVNFGENRNVNNFAIDDKGNIYTYEYEWLEEPDENGQTERNILAKYDAQGQTIAEQDITYIVHEEEESAYVNSFAVDGEGRLYLTSESVIWLFDADYNFQGKISIADNIGWLNGIGTGKDGKVYISYYDQTSTDGKLALTELDFAGKKLGKSYNGFPYGNGGGNLMVGEEHDFLINDGSKLYGYNMENGETEEILSWLDCDINGSYVDKVAAVSDGKLVAMIRNWDTDETELALLTKTKTAELPQKQEIVIGTLYDVQGLQAAAVDFNKSSDAYRIKIKTYIDSNNWTENSWSDALMQLNNDITSGSNCPDILDLSQVDMKQLAAKGVFEDLNPYLEKSSVLSKEDYLESVLACWTYDNKLLSIPESFRLSTIVGKSADVGTEMGWTVDELIAYAQKHPESNLFDGETKASIMYSMLAFEQDAFINWESGECKFDSDEFKKILEFVNTFPTEFDWESDQRSTPVKIQAGDVLLNMVYIYELTSIQEQDAIFNEPITFIGYPSENGGSGCYIQGNESYAITSKSNNKEGAWAFIEHYLSTERGDMFSWGIPSRKADFEKKIEEATKVEYLLDENGQQILDEEGNPIMEGGTSSIGYGDWEYTYHNPTEEEINRLRELIEVAQPATNANEAIMNIINEEAEAFFQGQKSVDDVASIIQSRIQVYVNENR